MGNLKKTISLLCSMACVHYVPSLYSNVLIITHNGEDFTPLILCRNKCSQSWGISGNILRLGLRFNKTYAVV